MNATGETAIPDDAAVVPSLGFLCAHPAHFIALGFGSGLSALIPGTMGTLFAWLCHYLLMALWPEIFSVPVWAAVIVIGFIIGVWACHRTGKDMGKPDHGAMVWDEIIAFWLVLLFVTPAGWWTQLCAFVLFRAFDMLKPQPIRYFDQNLKGGFGVMWDDIVAAFYVLLVFALWRVIHS